MSKAQELRELENSAKGTIEAMFLAMQTGRPIGLFKESLDAALEAAEALTRKKKR